MIIAVTGTPGTGKTAVAETLAAEFGTASIDVNAVSERSDVATAPDEERDATAVDVDSLVDALKQAVDGDAVLDGHLAHHYPADLTVVLRCEPDTLRERLCAKGWDDSKIEENVEAERLAVILQQAAADRDRVMEVDTTDRDAGQVVDAIEAVVDDGVVPEQYRPGHVTWDLSPETG